MPVNYDYHFFPIPVQGGRTAIVSAGPTRGCPRDRALVRLAPEVPFHGDVFDEIPTEDFEPLPFDEVLRVAPRVINDALEGKAIHVGCMAGIGRTGTFLACLVAHNPAFDGLEAVRYVRQFYRPDAVETQAQVTLVCAVAEHIIKKGKGPLSWETQFLDRVDVSDTGWSGVRRGDEGHPASYDPDWDSLQDKLGGPTDPGNDAAFYPLKDKTLRHATLLDYIVAKLT